MSPTPPPDDLDQTDRHAPIDSSADAQAAAASAFLSPALFATLSMDQLVQMMMMASQELRKRHSVPRNDHESTGIFSVPAGTVELDLETPAVEEQYRILPERLADTANEARNAWRVVLFSSNPTHPLLALHIVGDIVVGRKVEGVSPDLDMTNFDPGNMGVSRVHALIRPTTDQLQLSDLGSTNGTFIDGERLTPGRVVGLKDGATLAFGKCHFRLSIVARPGAD